MKTLATSGHLEYRIGHKERYLVRRRYQIRERTRQMRRAMLAATVDPLPWPPIVFSNGVLHRCHPCPVLLKLLHGIRVPSSWLVR